MYASTVDTRLNILTKDGGILRIINVLENQETPNKL